MILLVYLLAVYVLPCYSIALESIMNSYNELVFECPFCGLQAEIEWTKLDTHTPTIECEMCHSSWRTSYTPGDIWLNPIEQVPA